MFQFLYWAVYPFKNLDLLFYHCKLQSLVVIELKMGEFKPEHAGKLNFYLEILDDTVKMPHENLSIGILLCASKEDWKTGR